MCESPGCDKPAKLQCPTCIKLNIQVSHIITFCLDTYIKLMTSSLHSIVPFFCDWDYKGILPSIFEKNKCLQGSYFCNQDCFKSNWDLHKNLHKLAKSGVASQSSKKGSGLFNPWPTFNFTGQLLCVSTAHSSALLFNSANVPHYRNCYEQRVLSNHCLRWIERCFLDLSISIGEKK